MATKQINPERFSVTSSKAFTGVIAAFEAAVGHPDMKSFQKNVAATKTYAELEKVVRGAVGPSGLMEFARFDLGEVLRNARGAQAPQSLRFVVGNPLIMEQMVKDVPDAGSYAPVTILVDQHQDGIRLSYDRIASLLAQRDHAAGLGISGVSHDQLVPWKRSLARLGQHRLGGCLPISKLRGLLPLQSWTRRRPGAAIMYTWKRERRALPLAAGPRRI